MKSFGEERISGVEMESFIFRQCSMRLKKFSCRNVNCETKNSPTAKDIYVKAFEEDMSEK